MKRGNLKKKVSTIFLAAAMIVTSFPALRMEVHAAELPTTSQFATKEDLKKFDTDDKNTNGKNPAKVYFGQNGSGSAQAWWIAGSQNGNLTLFAASPLATDQPFYGEKVDQSKPNITYNAGWGCIYQDTAPTEVHVNYYGASPVRTTLKKIEEDTNYFSNVEQGLMNSTTIYTKDVKNVKTYSTKDKLYLAYGDHEKNSDYITVGTNTDNMDSLNSGLHIDSGYWGIRDPGEGFWLRAPSPLHSIRVLVGVLSSSYCVADTPLNTDPAPAHDLKPAFELKLNSVLFASAAPAASADGKLETEDVTSNDVAGAFTLRYTSQNGIGTATISGSKQNVTVTGVAGENTYLVVQNNEGAWAKRVKNNDSILASEMNSTLTSFENCKVWLETTDGITYAAMAVDGQSTYGMGVSGEGTFDSKCVGYTSAPEAEFTITNTGDAALTNVQVSVTGADSGSFTLIQDNSVTSIQSNGTATVTVKPNGNLGVKNYQAQLSVSADHCTTVTKDLQFEVKNHVYQDVVTPPTCTQKGFTTHTCQNCGDEYKDNETEMIPHDWEDTYTVDKEPTCRSEGSQSVHCKNCDATKDSQTISKVEHKFTDYVSNHDATCTQDGTKTAACEYGCGETDTLPDEGSMLEHQPSEWIIDQAATADADGKRHKECTVCGQVLETGTIPATGTTESEYKVLEGADQTYSGSGGLSIRANGDFSKFTGIKVDGNAVDASNYEARSGSTIVTLKESYLSTLSAGKHTIAFVYNDGEVSTSFTTVDGKGTTETPGTTDPGKDTPGTGNGTGSGKDTPGTGNGEGSNTNKTAADQNRSPETGDRMNSGLYLLLFVMSGGMLAFCAERKRAKVHGRRS